MVKNATLNLRVDASVKEKAESVLSKLGVPMSTAIDMYLNQIALTGGIPFKVALPQAPETIDMGRLSKEEISDLLQAGMDDVLAGRVCDAKNAFEDFEKKYLI